jgi:hypothetical protein
MTLRRALVATAALTVLAGCAPRVAVIPRSVPAGVQLDLLRLPRLWVAGFVADGQARVDLGDETARLVRQQIGGTTVAGIVDANAMSLSDESIFQDREFWQHLGEELGYPLIVTGSVQLLVAPATPVQRGRRVAYVHGSGRVLRGTIVLIDGRTGQVLGSRDVPQRTRYANGSAWSADTLYYELMDLTLPDWLEAISTTYVERGASK